jgi:hypothetical protein
VSNVTNYAAKLQLDWLLGGTTPTRPTNRYVGLSLGTPTTVSGSEVLPNSGYLRQTILFGTANTNAVGGASASNTASFSFGPFSSSAAILGVVVYDTSAFTTGNMLWAGTLSVARTVFPGDKIVFEAGNFAVTLS